MYRKGAKYKPIWPPNCLGLVTESEVVGEIVEIVVGGASYGPPTTINVSKKLSGYQRKRLCMYFPLFEKKSNIQVIEEPVSAEMI